VKKKEAINVKLVEREIENMDGIILPFICQTMYLVYGYAKDV
jgi:hypothetical protein